MAKIKHVLLYTIQDLLCTGKGFNELPYCTAPTYAIDLIAEQAGHEALRTPPYHPELQPIETCWGIVKNQVARNCDFTMANFLLQLDAAFASVTEKTCTGLIKKIRLIEDAFWASDAELDT